MNRQLIRSYILLVAVAILLFTVPVAFTLTDQLRDDTESSVKREATTMALLLANGDEASCRALTKMAEAYAEETKDEVQVTATARCAAAVSRPARDADLKKVLEQGRSTTDWGSHFIWGRDLVITVPAKSDGQVVGAVRIVYSTSGLTHRLWTIWGFRAGLAVAVLGVAALIGAVAARRITAPSVNSTAWQAGSATAT